MKRINPFDKTLIVKVVLENSGKLLKVDHYRLFKMKGEIADSTFFQN